MPVDPEPTEPVQAGSMTRDAGPCGPMPAKGRTRIQERNRAAILEAGLECFSQSGFRGATLDQIAAAAGLSKPNVLYYFASKDAIYETLLERLLATWLDPLLQMDPGGDPREEILGYVRRKLDLSRDFPRESRLFAGEILAGAPRIEAFLGAELKDVVEAKAAVIGRWVAEGRLAPIEPRHLIVSIWALTQHYADFEVQIRAVLGGADPFAEAGPFLETLFARALDPGPP